MMPSQNAGIAKLSVKNTRPLVDRPAAAEPGDEAEGSEMSAASTALYASGTGSAAMCWDHQVAGSW